MEENHRNDINFFCHLETWHNQHTSKMWLEFILGFIRAFKWEFFFLFVYSFSLYYWHSASIFTYFSGVYILRDARESHLCWYIHTYIHILPCGCFIGLTNFIYMYIYTQFEFRNDKRHTVNLQGQHKWHHPHASIESLFSLSHYVDIKPPDIVFLSFFFVLYRHMPFVCVCT